MTKQKNETGENNVIITTKKRGRKSKKELLELSKEKKDNISIFIEENMNNNNSNIEEVLKCCDEQNEEQNEEQSEIEDNIYLKIDKEIISDPKPGAKKRGRKPKGGKIIQQMVSLNNNKETKPNVILHLKCFIKDLQNNTILGPNIEGFNFAINNINNNTNDYSYEIITNNYNNTNMTKNNFNTNTVSEHSVTKNTFFECNDNETTYDYDDEVKQNKENDIREIWKKLKVLEHNLHINNISDKKSACFWCTYEFDNPPIYIPKHHIKETYNVYGCFCSPECATAYLMEENIDSSSKFERYHLINHIYSKIYDYKKNIKPAPNPYYMLEKYYGNLTIQEFRSLLKNDRLFLVVDKPLTRILPELHEDNDDFIINNKIIPSNTYQIKKKLQKKQLTKNNILTEKFGLAQ